MIKMESPNRKGQWKMFRESDIESAKANGWKEFGKSKAKKVSKAKGDK